MRTSRPRWSPPLLLLLPPRHCCEQVIPPLLAEFELRSTDPLRVLAHRLLPFLPAARRYRERVQARRGGEGRGGWGVGGRVAGSPALPCFM